MSSTAIDPDVEYRPAFPADYRPGIGLIGYGDIARSWHVPAYEKYGVRVVGVYDPAPAATAGLRGPRVFTTLDDLLADEEVEIVDVATRPDVRPGLFRQAIAAGKHVLAQKPLALDVAEDAGPGSPPTLAG